MSDYPSLRHRRLTALLRQLRHESGLTGDEVAERLEWVPSKIRRIETGRWQRLQPRDVRGLLECYGITDPDEQEPYVQLARDARQRGWWTQYTDVIGPYVGFEAEASSIQTYQSAYIPGLLQTEDYARALLQSNPTANPELGERRIAAQLERQKLLTRENPPQFWAVLWEPVLYCPVGGGEVMAEQLRYVRDVAAGPQHITVQVLPLAAGPHPGMDGAFVLLTFPDPVDQPVIYLETATDGLYPEGMDLLNRYTLMFDHLRATALSVNDSVALLDRGDR